MSADPGVAGALPWWIIPTVIFAMIALLAILLTITTPPRGHQANLTRRNTPCPPPDAAPSTPTTAATTTPDAPTTPASARPSGPAS